MITPAEGRFRENLDISWGTSLPAEVGGVADAGLPQIGEAPRTNIPLRGRWALALAGESSRRW